MNLTEWHTLLSGFKLFNCLDSDQVTRLIEVSQQVEFDADQVILREGDVDKEGTLFIVGVGTVSIALSGVAGHKILVDTMGPGDFFGEMAWLEQKPRSATVIAAAKCSLTKVSGENFQHLMESNAVFASRVATILSERLRRLIEHVLAVKLKDFDEKLQLTNTKLDASLKSIESQQKAAHTVFEEINTRANEVIHSAERSRTRTAQVFTGVGVVLSLLGFFLGKEFFNLKGIAGEVNSLSTSLEEEVSSLSNSLEQKVAEINGDIKEFEDLKLQSEKLVTSINKTESEISETRKLTDLQFYLTKYAISDTFKESIKRTTLAELRSGKGRALNFYGKVLKVKDPDLTEELFKVFESYLLQESQVDKVDSLLKAGLDKKFAKTEKQQALTFYYLLAIDLLNDDDIAFRTHLRSFNLFSRDSKPVKFVKDFGPSWFAFPIMKRDAENAEAKIEQLNEVWRKLSD